MAIKNKLSILGPRRGLTYCTRWENVAAEPRNKQSCRQERNDEAPKRKVIGVKAVVGNAHQICAECGAAGKHRKKITVELSESAQAGGGHPPNRPNEAGYINGVCN